MLNVWDNNKEEVFDHIFNNIDWSMVDKPTGEVEVELSFTPQDPSNKVEFPTATLVFASQEEYQKQQESHYRSTAVFFTMVQLGEDIIIDYEQERVGYLIFHTTKFMPVTSENTKSFIRFWRFKKADKKIKFIPFSKKISGFFEKQTKARGHMLNVRVEKAKDNLG